MPPGLVPKYNPRLSPPDELCSTFVARQELLLDLLRELRARATAPANQHVLITGPRGIGKTNLLLMIRHSVESDGQLKQAYLPVQTAEEEYSITSLKLLFAKLASLMLEKRQDDALASAVLDAANIRDDDHAAEALIEAVKGFAGRARLKILFLVDNLDLILGDQLDDDAQLGRLRDILMNGSFLVLIAAAPTYFKEVRGYGRPFYEFFRHIALDDLTREQMVEMLRKRAEWEGNRTILDNMQELGERIAAVHHLTGGNPRLVLMLYELCAAGGLPEVRAALQSLLDDVTPYYKARLERLAPQQRRVMDVFARLGRPATPTELAQETGLPINQINSILQRLREHGFVAVGRQERRKSTYYVVSEQVFRIWHQMRFATSGKRLEFLIQFIRLWYTAQQWGQETQRYIQAYGQAALAKRSTEAAGYLEQLTYLIHAAPDGASGLGALRHTVTKCVQSHDYGHAETILDEQESRWEAKKRTPELAAVWLLRAGLREAQGRTEDEIAALRKAVELQPSCPGALNNLGVATAKQAETRTGGEREALLREACQRFQAALTLEPEDHRALGNWGSALLELAKGMAGTGREALLREACRKHEAAVKMKPDDAAALYNWGVTLVVLAKARHPGEWKSLLGEAREKFEAAANVEPDMHEALYNCGVALIDLASANSGGQREALLRQACAKFEAIVRIKPDEYRALSNWGAALVSLALARTEAGREAVLREACQKFEATVTVKPNEYRALNNWGVALLFLARTTSGVEKRSLLLEAAAKVAEARCCAASMGDEAACREYAANICSIVLSLCAYLVEAGDVASAAERFRQALSLLGQVESQISRRALAALFRGAAKESTADLCAQFFQDMRDKGLNDELAFLDPFVKAVEYWQKGKDAEVLDRLNPEVRKLVEEIVGARPK